MPFILGLLLFLLDHGLLELIQHQLFVLLLDGLADDHLVHHILHNLEEIFCRIGAFDFELMEHFVDQNANENKSRTNVAKFPIRAFKSSVLFVYSQSLQLLLLKVGIHHEVILATHIIQK